MLGKILVLMYVSVIGASLVTDHITFEPYMVTQLFLVLIMGGIGLILRYLRAFPALLKEFEPTIVIQPVTTEDKLSKEFKEKKDANI